MWGGVNLGKARFEHIQECARSLLYAAGHRPGEGIRHDWGLGHTLGGSAGSSSDLKHDMPGSASTVVQLWDGGDSSEGDGDGVGGGDSSAAVAAPSRKRKLGGSSAVPAVVDEAAARREAIAAAAERRLQALHGRL